MTDAWTPGAKELIIESPARRRPAKPAEGVFEKARAMKIKIFLCFSLFAAGVFILETGLLSVLVAVAYRTFRGSGVPAIGGTLLMVLGAVFVVKAKRWFLKKEVPKEGSLY